VTFEVLEEIRLYVGCTGRAARQAAQNCRLNGYRELAQQRENEASLADKIIRELAGEYGEIDAQSKSKIEV
jgi:hypothetical protein